MLRTGVSTASLYPELTEVALRELAEGGVRTTEVFINAPSEISPSSLRELCAIKETYGMEIVSLHPFSSGIEPFMLFSGYERRYHDMLDYYRQFFDAMNTLGASIFVLHGDRRDSAFPDEAYFERYLGLFRLGEQCGVTVAQENVSRCRSADPSFLQKMRETLREECAFVVDLKQAVRSGCTAYDVLDAVGDKLCNLHVSDSAPGEDCLPPGKGTFDFARLVRFLHEKEYEGALLLELYRQNYQDYASLLESARYLQEMVNMLEH